MFFLSIYSVFSDVSSEFLQKIKIESDQIIWFGYPGLFAEVATIGQQDLRPFTSNSMFKSKKTRRKHFDAFMNIFVFSKTMFYN